MMGNYIRVITGLLLISSCSDSKTGSGNLDPATGGMVAIDNASVTVPPNALSAPTMVSVSSDSTAAPASLGTPVSGMFRFEPEGLTFQTPVTVTLAVDSAKLGGRPLTEVFIATAPAGSTNFSPLTTTAADAGHVAAQTSHFSLFIAILPPATDSAVPSDGGVNDLAVLLDGPAPMNDPAASPSPSPSCSPWPTPPPSPPCSVGPAPSPSLTCSLEMLCGSTTRAYGVYCNLGNTCYCYKDGTITDSFAAAGYCGMADGGTNSALWQRCCYPGAP